MRFSDIIGQETVKSLLTDMAETGKIPHALMLTGKEGTGAFPLVLAYAQMLLCQGPPKPEVKQEPMGLFGMEQPSMSLFGDEVETTAEPISETADKEKPCEQCRSCLMVQKLQHPDLHFIFPIYKVKGRTSDNPTYCDDYISEWREMVAENPYFTYADWMEASGAENQQLTIYEAESDAIFKKLSLVASQGGYKVCVCWLPEKMNEACSNKILKLIEEPPENTVFLMASEHPDQLLPTIRSRVQEIQLPPLGEDEIASALVEQKGIMPGTAEQIGHIAQGSWSAALKLIGDNHENQEYFNLFVSLMRLSYVRKVKEMKQWSEEVAALGRERQKKFLAYCQRMVRENFIYNFHDQRLNYMTEDESNFAVRFAPFINENNVIGIMNELARCERDIAQNGNPKIVFFDFSLKMIVLIKNR